MKRLAIVIVLVLSQILAACGATATPAASPTLAPVATTAPSQAAATLAPTQAPATATDVPPSPTAGPTVGGALVLGVPWEPDILDPHKTSHGGASYVMSFLGATLVARSPSGDIVPFLAESWKMSDDGLVWDFSIRKGVQFHDGSPLTAASFAWTYDRARDPAIKSPVARTLLASIASTEAPDDYTLRLNLSAPFFPLLDTLTNYGYLQPLPRGAVEQLGDQFGRQPVGAGPYRFREWVTGQRIVLERNPDFAWSPAFAQSKAPYVETVEFRFIPEYATIVAGLEAGEVDVATVDAKDAARVLGTGQFSLAETLVQGLVPFISLNTSKPPFDDIRVRKAFNLAVDRQSLIAVAALGNAIEQRGPLSPSQPGYWSRVEEIGYGFDLAQAKSLMAEAGYTADGNGWLQKDGQTLDLVLHAPTTDIDTKVSEVLKEQYKALGVDVEIRLEEWGILIPAVLTGGYEMSIFMMQYDQADVLYLQFHSGSIGSLNTGMVRNTELDSVLLSTRTITDAAKRQQAVNEAQRIIVEQAYIVPLYVSKRLTAISKRTSGVMLTQAGYLMPYDLSVSR